MRSKRPTTSRIPNPRFQRNRSESFTHQCGRSPESLKVLNQSNMFGKYVSSLQMYSQQVTFAGNISHIYCHVGPWEPGMFMVTEAMQCNWRITLCLEDGSWGRKAKSLLSKESCGGKVMTGLESRKKKLSLAVMEYDRAIARRAYNQCKHT